MKIQPRNNPMLLWRLTWLKAEIEKLQAEFDDHAKNLKDDITQAPNYDPATRYKLFNDRAEIYTNTLTSLDEEQALSLLKQPKKLFIAFAGGALALKPGKNLAFALSLGLIHQSRSAPALKLKVTK